MEVFIQTTFLLWYLWAFWGMYVLVMGIYRAYLSDKMTPLLKFLSLPYVVVGGVMDVLANIFIASFIFLDPPREWLVTTRLTRYKNQEKNDWRKQWATIVCSYLLDVFDPDGNHCD